MRRPDTRALRPEPIARWAALLCALLLTCPSHAVELLLGGHADVGGAGLSDDVAEFNGAGPDFGLLTGAELFLLWRAENGVDVGIVAGYHYEGHSMPDQEPRVDYNFALSLGNIGALIRGDFGDLFTLSGHLDMVFGALTLEYYVDNGSSRILNGVNPPVVGMQGALEGIFRFPTSDTLTVEAGTFFRVLAMRHEDIEIQGNEPPFIDFFQSDQDTTWGYGFGVKVGLTYSIE